MPQINPFVHFNGNAEEAFTFYQSVFGGSFFGLMRFKDLPQNPDFTLPETEANKIMYIALPVGNGSVLMGSDVPEFMGRINETENRSKISVRADSKVEADTLFKGLSLGGTIEVPFNQSPWGTYFGMFRDKYGIEWMVEFDERLKNR